MLPQPEVLRVGAAGVVDRRQARNLGDAGLDGVHQAEVADDPRKRGPLGVSAALDVERRRREVHAEADAAGRVDPVQPAHPHGGLLAVRLLLRRELRRFIDRRGPIGVVPLVVQHHQRLVVPEVAETSARERLRRLLAEPPDLHPAHRDRLRLRVEAVPVGHQHLALGELRAHRGRHDVELLVVAAGVAGAEHAQALPDGQVRTDHQHPARIARIARLGPAVAERPRDEHGHDHGLSGAGRHLAGVAWNGVQARLVGEVRELRVLRHRRDPLPGPRVASRPQRLELVRGKLGPPSRPLARGQDLLEIEDGLDRLQLAEEQAARPIGAPPVTKQLPGGLRGVAPTRLPPAPNVLAQGVDERQVVALLLGEEQRPLRGPGALGLEPVARLAAGRDLRRPAGPRVVQPVPVRLVVGRAEDGVPDRLDGDGSVRHGSVVLKVRGDSIAQVLEFGTELIQ